MDDTHGGDYRISILEGAKEYVTFVVLLPKARLNTGVANIEGKTFVDVMASCEGLRCVPNTW